MATATGDDKMKRIALWALVGALALVVSVAGVLANNGRIFIGEDEESTHTADAAIAPEEAKSIAENHTNGTAISVELENEDGYLVYGVIIENQTAKYDVKIDAGSGSVLKVENDDDTSETDEPENDEKENTEK